MGVRGCPPHHIQGSAHKRWSVAITGVLLFKGVRGCTPHRAKRAVVHIQGGAYTRHCGYKVVHTQGGAHLVI